MGSFWYAWGVRQTDGEANWGLMGLLIAYGTCPSRHALGPLKGRTTFGAASGAATVKWTDISSPAAMGVGRRTPLPLGLAVCLMGDGLQDCIPSETLPQAVAPLCAVATQDGDTH